MFKLFIIDFYIFSAIGGTNLNCKYLKIFIHYDIFFDTAAAFVNITLIRSYWAVIVGNEDLLNDRCNVT